MEEHFKIEISERLTKVETILENQNDILNKILEQTSKTNGRVNQLEKNESKNKGIFMAIGAIISGIISIAGLVIGYLSLH